MKTHHSPKRRFTRSDARFVVICCVVTVSISLLVNFALMAMTDSSFWVAFPTSAGLVFGTAGLVLTMLGVIRSEKVHRAELAHGTSERWSRIRESKEAQ